MIHLGDIIFRKKNQPKSKNWALFERVGDYALRLTANVRYVIQIIKTVFVGMFQAIGGKPQFRIVDFWWELDKAGIRAAPIVCLISFMVGLIIAFVGHMQLAMFGAEIYVAALVAISMIRILGAVMT